MEQSFGVIFFRRKSNRQSDLEGIIYMRITVNGEYVDLSTKRTCIRERWNSRAGKAVGKTAEVLQLNAYLDTCRMKVFEAKRKMLELDEEINAAKLKDILLGVDKRKTQKTLISIFEKHNEQMAALVGKQYAPATLVRYNTTLKHTKAFLQWKYRLEDIEIKKLNYEFITEFEFWFRSVRNCDNNTTIKYLRNVRKIINISIKHGWLQRDPFFGFAMTKKEVERVPLNEAELQIISGKVFTIKRLELVRDIFLFSCYTGLAYVDVKNLKRADIVIGVDGEYWLFINRQKTNNSSRIPLLPAAGRIIEKYNLESTPPSDKVLPALSNQKMNAYLKEIADLCGIHKRLTFHIARHTFATTVTLSNGVPIETVSKMLGHKDIRSTQLYAKIVDLKTSSDMKNIKLRYV